LSVYLAPAVLRTAYGKDIFIVDPRLSLRSTPWAEKRMSSHLAMLGVRTEEFYFLAGE
jgi:hypothetical protein